MVSAKREAERLFHTLTKRCVECPPLATPVCPDCPSGQICSLVPRGCSSCSYMTCIMNPTPAPSSPKVNVGAIAGGVIGGVAAVALIILIFWRFWIKERRQEQELTEWDDDIAQQKSSRFTESYPDAASTRTHGSIATTILSHASNIIHIAYIPGVTNRSGNSSLRTTAPVPPIPAAYANANQKTNISKGGGALFFRPGSFRGSTFSDAASSRRNTKYSITSSLARSSMISNDDVYRDDATAEPMPALQVVRAAPRMVSVKNSAASHPESAISHASPAAEKVTIPGQSGSQKGASFARATEIAIGAKGKGKVSVVATKDSDTLSTTPGEKGFPGSSLALVELAEDSEDEDEHARARRSLILATQRAAASTPLKQSIQSPFFDSSDLQSRPSSPPGESRPNPYTAMSGTVRAERPRRGDRNTLTNLNAIPEEAKSTSQGSDRSNKRGTSPFSDTHATK